MKIISLTMNAFLAYKEKTTIHFEDMIDHGLYLISGPTGAGKTTIFDAITFALYGSASGSERNQSYFRSDFASIEEETYVELTFELHQNIYTVKRSPTYTRVGYKTPKMANAYFTHQHETIEGVKEVNAKIKQLLGVDEKQFKQIVMIAQGEFTKLIYASSEEREKVLRHIFHSESLVSFENKIKEETKKLKENYSLSSQHLLSRYQLLSLPEDFMKTHKDGFHPSYIEEADLENEKIKEKQTLLQSQYDHIQNEYNLFSQSFYQKQKQNEDILIYQKLQQQYELLQLKQDNMNNCKEEIDKLKMIEKNQTCIHQYHYTNQELHHLKDEKKLTSDRYQGLQKEFHEIKKNYDNISLLQQQKDNLMIEIEKIKQAIDKQKTYQDILLKEQNLSSQLDTYKQKYNQLYEEHHKFVKRMERDQENIEQLPTLQLELQQNEQLMNEMNQRRITIHELSDLFDQYIYILDDHFGYSEKYKAASQCYLDLSEKYNREDENFKYQQAGILASLLKDDQPCPVCGSIEHPHPAKLSQEVFSSDELEELARDVEKAKEKKEDTYQQVLIQNQRVQDIKTQITLLKKQLNIQEDLTKEVFIRLLADISVVMKDQEKTYQKRHTEVEYLKKVRKSLEQDQIRSSLEINELDKYQLKIHDNEKQCIAFQTQLNELKQNEVLLFDSLELKYQEKNQEMITLTQQIQTLDQTYHQHLKDISVLKNQLDTLESREKELDLNFIKLKEEYDHFIKEVFVDEENYLSYASLLESLNEKEKEYQDYMIELKTVSSRLEELHKTMKDKDLIDLSLEKEKLDELSVQKENCFKEMNQYLQTYEQNLSLLKLLKKDYSTNQDVFEKYTMYLDLADMASGKNKQRLSFERYVLSSYFEHILEYANVELLKMSHGRYAMYRKKETKGASQQGLDLSVLDYETGMLRDIQSLSGGESFKAALSLALGLSSMIQSYAGGIELNTLFIDEGFGSLDSESIDQALSVLLDMKNDNKVIGIISHVSELKERITTQIVVDKTKQGSFLHIERE